ncbi:hypothetical protein [Neorhizobium sp. P12A]|nr:hypothetical protein [Neorhizobium sp. P12A]
MKKMTGNQVNPVMHSFVIGLSSLHYGPIAAFQKRKRTPKRPIVER